MHCIMYCDAEADAGRHAAPFWHLPFRVDAREAVRRILAPPSFETTATVRGGGRRTVTDYWEEPVCSWWKSICGSRLLTGLPKQKLKPRRHQELEHVSCRWIITVVLVVSSDNQLLSMLQQGPRVNPAYLVRPLSMLMRHATTGRDTGLISTLSHSFIPNLCLECQIRACIATHQEGYDRHTVR